VQLVVLEQLKITQGGEEEQEDHIIGAEGVYTICSLVTMSIKQANQSQILMHQLMKKRFKITQNALADDV
jgi:hypothetical protein